MKGAMLGKLFVDVSDGGITTTEWKVGRVVDVTAITVTARDRTRQVNTHTVKWRESMRMESSHKLVGLARAQRTCSADKTDRILWPPHGPLPRGVN